MRTYRDSLYLEKHDVDFSTVATVIDDPKCLIVPNQKHRLNEGRFYAIGHDGRDILTVRHTRRGEAIRIIDAGYWWKQKKFVKTKTKKLVHVDEPKEPGWEFDEANILTREQARAAGTLDPNPPGTAYERIEKDGLVQLIPQRGGARPGAGRKPSGHVRMQILVKPEIRRKIERLAKSRKVTFSTVVEEAVQSAR